MGLYLLIFCAIIYLIKRLIIVRDINLFESFRFVRKGPLRGGSRTNHISFKRDVNIPHSNAQIGELFYIEFKNPEKLKRITCICNRVSCRTLQVRANFSRFNPPTKPSRPTANLQSSLAFSSK
jgi:hypothetical protein